MKKWTESLQIAAAFIGTIVGAGFASGREIIQFFSQYQTSGTIGAMVSGVLMSWAGTKMMVYAHRIRAYSFHELMLHLLGSRFGTAIQALLFFIIFGMTGVMLAGAGAVFQEQLGWYRQSGIILAALAGFFFLLKGVRGLLWVNSLVVPLMVTFVIAVFLMNGAEISVPTDLVGSGWLPAALGYAAFNILTALVVLVPLARETKDERVLRRGALLGGAGFAVLLLLAHFLILGHPDVLMRDMPMAELVKPFGRVMHLVFVSVVFGEILTTFTGNIFGLARQLHSLFPTRFSPRYAMLLLIAGALLISQAGYGSLIRTLYPAYGLLCSAIFLFLCLVSLPPKMK